MTTPMKVEEYPSWIVDIKELHENCIKSRMRGGNKSYTN
jgi:hypothetical protein